MKGILLNKQLWNNTQENTVFMVIVHEMEHIIFHIINYLWNIKAFKAIMLITVINLKYLTFLENAIHTLCALNWTILAKDGLGQGWTFRQNV